AATPSIAPMLMSVRMTPCWPGLRAAASRPLGLTEARRIDFAGTAAAGATAVGIERATRMRGAATRRCVRRSWSRASRRLDGGVAPEDATGVDPAVVLGRVRPVAAAFRRPSSVRVMKYFSYTRCLGSDA